MVEQVNALSLLKEEMSTDEIHLKVNAIHRLKTVIMSIGPQESTAQLIPYLNSLIEDQDDEVLFAIAEELGMCFDIMQDDKTAFLPLLEKLCQKDETVVREQASKSLISICKELDDSVLQNVFCPLIIRLADASWFPGRVSAIPLFFFAYAKANSQKEPLRKKFMELCQEDTPMIRRVCAAKLGEFATKLEKQHVIQELLPVFRQLSQDDQDSCRVLCIESLIPMARYLTKEENRVHTLGSLLNAGEDKSWKVRLCFARNFAQFAEAFGREITDNNLVQTFNQLLDDNEQEVRNAAINSLTLSLKNLGPEKICNILLPTLQSTLANAQIAFKCGMGLALCEMSPIVGKNYTETSVLPILTELLKADNSEVRLNVATNIHKLADVVGEDLLSQAFLQLLNGLVKDP